LYFLNLATDFLLLICLHLLQVFFCEPDDMQEFLWEVTHEVMHPSDPIAWTPMASPATYRVTIRDNFFTAVKQGKASYHH
jgi:hypothetical protein